MIWWVFRKLGQEILKMGDFFVTFYDWKVWRGEILVFLRFEVGLRDKSWNSTKLGQSFGKKVKIFWLFWILSFESSKFGSYQIEKSGFRKKIL